MDHAQLISRLTRDLRPVHRLAAPWKRAALWLAAALWIGLLLSFFTDFSALRLRLMAAPDMWLSQAGSVLTGALAGWAALQTGIPGRSMLWALLPLPPLALWLGAATAGCLRLWPVASTVPEPPMHAMACVEFLALVSLPLSVLLGWLLRRTCPLQPWLTTCLAGLAAAAVSSALLSLIHPFDATADDLLAHLFAVVCVIAGMRIWGGWSFRAGGVATGRDVADAGIPRPRMT